MDENKYPRFIPAVDLNWRGVLKGVTKAADPYQRDGGTDTVLKTKLFGLKVRHFNDIGFVSRK